MENTGFGAAGSWTSQQANRLSLKSAPAPAGQWSRGLCSPPENDAILCDDLAPASEMTLRHVLFMLQTLLAESQVNIAFRLVEEMTKESAISPLLDKQIAGAGDLSHRFLALLEIERDSLRSVFDRIGNVLEDVKPGAGTNLLDKLEKPFLQQTSSGSRTVPPAGRRPASAGREATGTRNSSGGIPNHRGSSGATTRAGDQKQRISISQSRNKSSGRSTIGAGYGSRYSMSPKPQPLPEGGSAPETRRASTFDDSKALASQERDLSNGAMKQRSSLMMPSQMEAMSDRPLPRVSLTHALGLDPMMMSKLKSASPPPPKGPPPVFRDTSGNRPPDNEGTRRKRDEAGNPPGGMLGAVPSAALEEPLEEQSAELAESDYGASTSDESMMVEDDVVRVAPFEPNSVSVQDISEVEPLGWPEVRAKSPVPPASPSPIETNRSVADEMPADMNRPQSCPTVLGAAPKDLPNLMSLDTFVGSGLTADSIRPHRNRLSHDLPPTAQFFDSADSQPNMRRERSWSWPTISRQPIVRPDISSVLHTGISGEGVANHAVGNDTPTDSELFSLEDKKGPDRVGPKDSMEMSGLREKNQVNQNDISEEIGLNIVQMKSTRFTLPERLSSTTTSDQELDSNSDASIQEIAGPYSSHSYSRGASSEAGDLDRRRKSIMSQSSHLAAPTKINSNVSMSRQDTDHPMYKFKQSTMNATKYFLMTTETLEEDQAAYLGQPSHQFIIHPSSMFRMSWDCISLVIILLESLILPMGLCFNMYPEDWVMWISTFFFTPDIVFNFFTGYYANGLLIMRQQLITKRYVLGWFSVDFFSTVPWEVILNDHGNASFMLKFAKIGKLMRVLRLLRIFKLKTLLQRVEDMFSSYIVLFTLSIAKTVGVYVIFCHWIACIWGYVGAYDGTAEPYDRSDCEPDGPCEKGLGINDSPWRRRYGLTDTRGGDQYLVSLQFATALLTGAELQLMPGRTFERVFVTFMTIVSFLVCSMIISQIVVIMEKINQDNSQYLEHTRMMRDFMVSRGMPIKLQTKVKRYLEYQFKSRKVVHQNHEVIQQLSPYLRIEIQEHMNRVILEHHPFFAGMEQSVLSQVCTLAKSELYAPGDIVLRRGQLSSLILFIVRGQLMINEARDGFDICLRAPAWIGDRGLFVTCELRHTVTCVSHSEILTIAQQDLIDLVSLFPSAEAYIKAYCKRVIVNDENVIFCDFCHQRGHDIDSCDELTEAVHERKRSSRHAEAKALKSAGKPAPFSLTFKNTVSTIKTFVSKTAEAPGFSKASVNALESKQRLSKTSRQSRNSQSLSTRMSYGISEVDSLPRGNTVDVCDAWGDD